MATDRLCVPVMQFLQFWRTWVVLVVWKRCDAFVCRAPADSHEQVEDRPHCITRSSSDGRTANQSEATSSGNGEWEEISTALTSERSAAFGELQISNNIDPAGEFKVPLGLADEASQPADAAAAGPSAKSCQIPPLRRSLEDSKDLDIITAQRTPKPAQELAVQDVKIGEEVWVVNTRLVPVANIKSEQFEVLDQDHVCIGVDARSEDRFREFGIPELDNAAAGGLLVEAKPLKGRGHVPPFVSAGSVATFAIDVDKTTTKLRPSLENYRTAAEDHAEVFANLEQSASPTQKTLPLKNDGNGSLGQGSSSKNSI